MEKPTPAADGRGPEIARESVVTLSYETRSCGVLRVRLFCRESGDDEIEVSLRAVDHRGEEYDEPMPLELLPVLARMLHQIESEIPRARLALQSLVP